MLTLVAANIKCTGLAAKDDNGLSDPFVVFNFLGKERKVHTHTHTLTAASFGDIGVAVIDTRGARSFDKDEKNHSFLSKVQWTQLKSALSPGGAFDVRPTRPHTHPHTDKPSV